MTVRMTQQVRELLGPQKAAEAEQAFRAGGLCTQCDQPISPNEDSNVSLGQGPAGQVGAIWYVHIRCRPSGVIDLPPEAIEAIVTPEDGHAMSMRPLLLPSGPALVAELKHRIVTGAPGAEATSVLISGLLGMGFTLVSDPDQDTDELAKWIGVLAPHGHALSLVILDPTGASFFTGTIAPPRDWQHAARATRSCTLLASDTIATSPTETDTVGHYAALTAAARAGRLVGGRITIGRRADYGL